jgi:hypothetical protein
MNRVGIPGRLAYWVDLEISRWSIVLIVEGEGNESAEGSGPIMEIKSRNVSRGTLRVLLFMVIEPLYGFFYV